MGHTFRRCRQPPKEAEPDDEARYSPGSPKRDEPDLLGPETNETNEEPFEYKRQDDDDLW